MSVPKYGEGAEARKTSRIAEAIMAWWHARGYPEVTASPEIILPGGTGKHTVWGVRSNLVNGLPPSAVKRGGR